MLISEIFHSIQGEGALTGVPSVFIRTSGCNLRCVWCDTPYASWRPEGREMDIDGILSEAALHPAKHCVLTGGEPMAAKNIHALAAALRAAGYHITIETAATIPPQAIACDLASLSPKLSNSTPPTIAIGAEWSQRHESTRLQPEVLEQWLRGYPFQLKFVVASASDIAEIDALLDQLSVRVEPWNILLMPEGTDEATLHSRQSALAELCKQRGNRFCDRLHIRLFGNQRGT